jgi:hypothetical protein
MPSYTSYATPYDAMNAAKADALKRASYLSSMDQFYAQLDESKRQFDQTYGLQVRTADLAERSQAWTEKYGTGQLALQSRGLDINEAQGFAKLDLERMGLKVNAVTSLAQLMMQQRQAQQETALRMQQLRQSGTGGGGSRSGGGGGMSSSQAYDVMQLQKKMLEMKMQESRNVTDAYGQHQVNQGSGYAGYGPTAPSSPEYTSLYNQLYSGAPPVSAGYGEPYLGGGMTGTESDY